MILWTKMSMIKQDPLTLKQLPLPSYLPRIQPGPGQLPSLAAMWRLTCSETKAGCTQVQRHRHHRHHRGSPILPPVRKIPVRQPNPRDIFHRTEGPLGPHFLGAGRTARMPRLPVLIRLPKLPALLIPLPWQRAPRKRTHWMVGRIVTEPQKTPEGELRPLLRSNRPGLPWDTSV